jgi:hypothetical protein
MLAAERCSSPSLSRSCRMTAGWVAPLPPSPTAQHVTLTMPLRDQYMSPVLRLRMGLMFMV